MKATGCGSFEKDQRLVFLETPTTCFHNCHLLHAMTREHTSTDHVNDTQEVCNHRDRIPLPSSISNMPTCCTPVYGTEM